MRRISDVLAQHGKIEDIMHTYHRIWQSKLICHWTNLLDNLEWSDISRTQLAFFTKPHYPSHRLNLEKHLFSYCELDWFTPLISKIFLPTLRHLHEALNHFNFFGSLLYQLWPQILLFTYFIPMNWRSTFRLIQRFTRSYADARIITIIVRELCQR